jgi:uncharacterized membrane protein
MTFEETVQRIGKGVDVAGVAIIVLGAAVASWFFLRQLGRRESFAEAYRNYRQHLGRTILLGLEFLVAGDIIRTVAVSPTFRSVGVLALIVGIRTFLSMALELELTGRWPWERQESSPTKGPVQSQ